MGRDGSQAGSERPTKWISFYLMNRFNVNETIEQKRNVNGKETGSEVTNQHMWLLFWLLKPETVPQAIIDMNRVVEVSEAEEVTGHSMSLALTAADRVHFLKGTSPEESKWWFDILSMFPSTNMKVSSSLTSNSLWAVHSISQILG